MPHEAHFCLEAAALGWQELRQVDVPPADGLIRPDLLLVHDGDINDAAGAGGIIQIECLIKVDLKMAKTRCRLMDRGGRVRGKRHYQEHGQALASATAAV